MNNASGEQNLSFPSKMTCPSENTSFVSKLLELEDFCILHWIWLKDEIFSPWSVWQCLLLSKSSWSYLWDLFLQDWVCGWHVEVRIHHWYDNKTAFPNFITIHVLHETCNGFYSISNFAFVTLLVGLLVCQFAWWTHCCITDPPLV